MGLGLCLVVLLPIKSDYERAFPGTDAHVAVDHKTDAAEHFLFGNALSAFQQRPNPGNQNLISFGHFALMQSELELFSVNEGTLPYRSVLRKDLHWVQEWG